MKITQYMTAEKVIIGADGSGIRQRWLYGLRLLHDPDAISTGNGGGLRHGKAEDLVTAATARGMKLNAVEIRNRLQCARTYPTESQIARVTFDFDNWTALVAARFPAYPADPDEPIADHRTQAERDHARAQEMLPLLGGQGQLFPLAEFEPTETTLLELVKYSDEQDEITERFARRGRERRAYLKALEEAVNYDMTQTWQAAHQAAYGSDPV